VVVGLFTARDILKKINKHDDKLAALKYEQDRTHNHSRLWGR
jgi:hypothetical protein